MKVRDSVSRLLDFPNITRLSISLRPKTSWMVIGCGLIVLWQVSFWRADRLPAHYRITASSGAWQETGQDYRRFFYFLFYKGLYPLASPETALTYSPAGADGLIREKGNTLVNELHHTYRSGDVGKVLLFWVDALKKGTPQGVQFIPANACGFILALLLLFIIAWRSERAILGLALVVFFGANPFQIFETYGNDNIFGWNITVTILLMALHLPTILGSVPRPSYQRWTLPIVTGILLASIRQIRSEPVILILPIAALYLFRVALPLKKRIVMIALLATAFVTGGKAWENYFKNQFDEAQAFVRAHHGTPFERQRRVYHGFWHPLFCGLGDFGDDKIYRWKDAVAYDYAQPLIEKKLGRKLVATGPYEHRLEDYADYPNVIREKVLGDVIGEPVWYAGILARRAARIGTEFSPPSVAFGRYTVSLWALGWLYFPMLLVLIWTRQWAGLWLVLFPSSTAATAFLIYSGGGTPFYFIGHLVTAVLFLLAAIEWVSRKNRAILS